MPEHSISQPEKLLSQVATYLYLERDKQILLARRYQTGWEDGKYTLIAGHVDVGEGITDAMIREAQEEAGIVINKQDLSMMHVMHRSNGGIPYIDFYFHATQWEGDPRIMEPHKCDHMQWFPRFQLPKNILDNVVLAIEYIDNNQSFSEII